MQVDLEGGVAADVAKGLGQRPRVLPAKYFYDRRGSELFEEICATPEYYVTRTETRLLRDVAPQLAKHVGPRARLVELGSGSSTKTRIVLDALVKPASYVPVDISADFLSDAAERLALEYPEIQVVPHVADFTRRFSIPDSAAGDRTVVFFPGSSIGNFTPVGIPSLLRRVRDKMGSNGQFVVGIDLVKDAAILNAAYNDEAGVTAAFNVNMLVHLNRYDDVKFVVDDFEHRSFFNVDESRIEMHLVARNDTVVLAGGEQFDIPRGETIRTELSHKFSVDGFATLARAAGLRLVRTWTDSKDWFAVQLYDSTPGLDV